MKSKFWIVSLLLIYGTHTASAQSFWKKVGKAVERELLSTDNKSINRQNEIETKITSPDSEVSVKLRKCEQVGEFVKISLTIINRSQIDFSLQLEADDGESMAFDPEGNVYSEGIQFNFGGKRGNVARSFLPKDTPVKCVINIPVQEPVDWLTKVVIFCRGISASLEKDQLQLANIPVMPGNELIN